MSKIGQKDTWFVIGSYTTECGVQTLKIPFSENDGGPPSLLDIECSHVLVKLDEQAQSLFGDCKRTSVEIRHESEL